MRQGSGKYVVAAFMVLEHCVGLTVLCIGHIVPTEVRFAPSAPDSDTGKRRRLLLTLGAYGDAGLRGAAEAPALAVRGAAGGARGASKKSP